MADNITMDAGSGGATLAADDISSVHYPRTKIVVGADGVNDGDVASGNPLPVDVISALPAGTAAIGKLAANSGVDIGDVDVLSHPADTFVADNGAYGKGVLCQGDDGTDRRSILVGTDGHVQCDIVGALPAGTAAIGKLAANSGVDIGDVDILSIAAGDNNIGNVDIVTHPADTFVAEDGALGKGVLIQGDDGTDRHNVAVDTDGNVQCDIVGALPAGTAAIGKLAANSGVDIGDVDVTSQPARDRTTDNVGAAAVLDAVMNDTTALTPTYKQFSVNTSGDNTLSISSVGDNVVVLSMILVAHGNVTVTIKSSTTTTISGPFEFDGASQPKGFNLAFSPVGHFETADGEDLNINLDAAVYVSGSLVYVHK